MRIHLSQAVLSGPWNPLRAPSAFGSIGRFRVRPRFGCTRAHSGPKAEPGNGNPAGQRRRSVTVTEPNFGVRRQSRYSSGKCSIRRVVASSVLCLRRNHAIGSWKPSSHIYLVCYYSLIHREGSQIFFWSSTGNLFKLLCPRDFSATQPLPFYLWFSQLHY